ncbi:hypothetical protein DV735_g1058, partial [Chaetothyriales sp. CBS 134920]
MPVTSVDIPTLSGITLKGDLYPAAEYGAAVILTPGFNCTKEMFVPDVALYFQSKGFTALAYDPRSTGASGGVPRNNIDPMAQVEDYSDALTFLAQQPTVDPTRIAFWGFSFAGAVSLCAAALDRRAKAVIAVCPLTRFEYTPELLPKVLSKAMKDRESQLQGNPPFYFPMIDENGENAAGFGLGVEKENYALLLNAKREVAPTFELQTTVQTYYKLFMWQPFALWRHVTPTPLLMIVPEKDKVSPAELQIKHFHSMPEPKTLHVAADRGHMDVLSGDGFPRLMDMQIGFLNDKLAED